MPILIDAEKLIDNQKHLRSNFDHITKTLYYWVGSSDELRVKINTQRKKFGLTVASKETKK